MTGRRREYEMTNSRMMPKGNNIISRRAVTGGLTSLAMGSSTFKIATVYGQTMEVKRTPEERFEGLQDYSYEPHYIEISNGNSGVLRMHYIDEGPRNGHVILCLHGQASWSYLYRNMIPIFVDKGYRVIAPDYIGFGRSDKLVSDADYSYEKNIDWLKSFLSGMKLRSVTGFLFDWGGHFGLRIAVENPEFFNHIILSNTLFPMGDQENSERFVQWAEQVVKLPVFPISQMVNQGVFNKLTPEIIEAYDAPFPDESFKAGPRSFPMIMPIASNRPAVSENQAAWQKLGNWQKPVLTLFSKRSAETEVPPIKFQEHIPGAKGQPHALLPETSFFIAEDKPEELATRVMDFIRT